MFRSHPFVSPYIFVSLYSFLGFSSGVASSIRTIAFNIGFMFSLNLAILTLTHYLLYEVAVHLIIVKNNTLYNDLNTAKIAIGNAFKVQALIMIMALPFTLSRMRR